MLRNVRNPALLARHLVNLVVLDETAIDESLALSLLPSQSVVHPHS